jgi:hypothetical protein
MRTRRSRDEDQEARKASGARASAARNIKIWAGAFREETQGLILTLTGTMKRFYFDLVGDLPARDVLGHECSSRKEARRHACFIAHRVGTERPNFAKQGNGISVRDQNGNEFFVAPISRLFERIDCTRNGMDQLTASKGAAQRKP